MTSNLINNFGILVLLLFLNNIILPGVGHASIGIYNPDQSGGKSVGGAAILNTLKESGIDAEYFSQMSIPELFKYSTIIVPSTERMSTNEVENRFDNLRAYVASAGGAIIFYYNSIGANNSPFAEIPLFPEIIDYQSIELVENNTVTVKKDPARAASQVLVPSDDDGLVSHLYDQHFAFATRGGNILVLDPNTRKVVVVTGKVGRGRVVFNGMWGGKYTGQVSRLEGIDKNILINTTRWCFAGNGLVVDDPEKIKVKKWKPRTDVEAIQHNRKVALIYGSSRKGGLGLAKQKITASGIDYDFIPMHFLPIRKLSANEYSLAIIFLQSGKYKESNEEFAQIESYLSSNGKAIIYLPKYSRKNNGGGRILKMIGAKPVRSYRNNPEALRKIMFSDFTYKVKQITNSVVGIADIDVSTITDAKVIAYWHDYLGSQKIPAVIKTNFGYVINNDTYGDSTNNRTFLANAVADLLSERKDSTYRNLTNAFKVQEELISQYKLSHRGKEFKKLSVELFDKSVKAASKNNYTSANSKILQAQDNLVKAYAASMPNVKGEERIVFTVANDLDPEITCRRLAEAGFSGIAISHLAGHYPSALYERVDDVKVDLMQKWIDIAHKYNLKVGPVFNTFSTRKGSSLFKKGIKDDWRVVSSDQYGKTPKKTIDDKVDRISFCRSHPDVVEYAISKSREILARYKVDFVFYDGIRWAEACYCNFCREQFQKDSGLSIENWPDEVMDKYLYEYNDWRAGHITTVSRKVRQLIADLNPTVKLGVYTFRGRKSSCAKGQYWWEWVNYVDYIMPMFYNPDNELLEELCGEINSLIPQNSRAKLVPCLAPNGYRSIDQFTMLKQIDIQREYAPTGIMYFRYHFFNDSNLDLLKTGPFMVQ